MDSAVQTKIKVRDTPFSPLNQVPALQAAGRAVHAAVLPPSPRSSTQPAGLHSGFAVQSCCRQQWFTYPCHVTLTICLELGKHQLALSYKLSDKLKSYINASLSPTDNKASFKKKKSCHLFYSITLFLSQTLRTNKKENQLQKDPRSQKWPVSDLH